jgi:hypothetical protein
MTESSGRGPAPGPARPVDGSGQPTAAPVERPGPETFDRLAERPVADHVEVFETEHARLQAELGTIDRL